MASPVLATSSPYLASLGHTFPSTYSVPGPAGQAGVSATAPTLQELPSRHEDMTGKVEMLRRKAAVSEPRPSELLLRSSDPGAVPRRMTGTGLPGRHPPELTGDQTARSPGSP